MKIYVASSWRNNYQQAVVSFLRRLGHEVYDFKNPPGRPGFAWDAVDAEWKDWSAKQYRTALTHPAAEEGFKSDFDAMKWADAFVLVQPCGRSAHLELGWACGAGKRTAVYIPEMVEPELMAKMADVIVLDVCELGEWAGKAS